MPKKTLIQETCQRSSKTYNQVSSQIILRSTFMPKKNLTRLTSLRKYHSKNMPTLRVDITEERGSPTSPPHGPWRGEIWTVLDRWRTAFFRLLSAFIILVSMTQVLELFQRLPVSDGLSPMPPPGEGGMTYCIPSFSGQKYGFSGPWSGLFLVWVHLPCFVFPESRI